MAPPATNAPRPPTNDEYALLVLANRARVEHRADMLPMRWSTGLANAAQYHDWDMITNHCFSHNSCNGGDWVKRVQSYYGTGWTALGENIAGGGTPQQTHDGWMASSADRANILSPSFTEFGGALMLDQSDFRIPYGTEDFGSHGLLAQSSLAGIPAAAVLEPADYSAASPQWQLALNFYDAVGPADVHAVVDGARVPLGLVAGTAANGTYSAMVGSRPYPASFCNKVHFEAKRANGQFACWPSSGEIGLGFDTSCWNVWQTVGGTTPTTNSSPTSTTPTTVKPNPGDAPVVLAIRQSRRRQGEGDGGVGRRQTPAAQERRVDHTPMDGEQERGEVRTAHDHSHGVRRQRSRRYEIADGHEITPRSLPHTGVDIRDRHGYRRSAGMSPS